MKIAKKWDKFLVRNIPKIRIIDGWSVEINAANTKLEIRLRYKEAPKKVLIVLSRGDKSICGIIYYFSKGKGPSIYIRLFRGQIGLVKVGERGRLRLCKNCLTYHLSLYHKEKKYIKCGGGYHKECLNKEKCARCFSRNYKWDNQSCPL